MCWQLDDSTRFVTLELSLVIPVQRQRLQPVDDFAHGPIQKGREVLITSAIH